MDRTEVKGEIYEGWGSGSSNLLLLIESLSSYHDFMKSRESKHPHILLFALVVKTIFETQASILLIQKESSQRASPQRFQVTSHNSEAVVTAQVSHGLVTLNYCQWCPAWVRVKDDNRKSISG